MYIKHIILYLLQYHCLLIIAQYSIRILQSMKISDVQYSLFIVEIGVIIISLTIEATGRDVNIN